MRNGHQPDISVVARLDFNKVVSATKRAEVLEDQLPRPPIEPARQFVKPLPSLGLPVAMPLAQRNSAPYRFQTLDNLIARHFRYRQIRLHGAHAAADIHTDRVGNNGTLAGRQDGGGTYRRLLVGYIALTISVTDVINKTA